MTDKIYIYCPRKSDGALELVKALSAVRLRKFDGIDFWNKSKRVKVPENSAVLCWGAAIPEMDGLRVLNGTEASHNKLKQAQLLASANVPTIKVITPDGTHTPRDYKNAGYVGRRFDHQGGTDLLKPVKVPDYYSKKERIVEEYRLHVFAGRSIRAGVKVLRDGWHIANNEKDYSVAAQLAHPWVRSYDGGWRIKYDGFKSTKEMRALATLAVKTLGLTFGAVDLAKLEVATGAPTSYIVLEVNSAPGLEGNTIQSYTKAIKNWVETGDTEEES